MNKFWEKVEHWNARLIPYAIVGLLFVIVVELFFADFAHHYHTPIAFLDYIIIAIFVVDIIFLGIRAKSTKYFFKHYWLDLVAIFPFAIAMNVLSRLYRLFAVGGRVAVGQAIVHESLEARKGVRALSRAGKFAKWLRIIARMIRVGTKSRLFAHFQTKHHLAKRNVKKGVNQRKAEKLKAKKAKQAKIVKKTRVVKKTNVVKRAKKKVVSKKGKRKK